MRLDLAAKYDVRVPRYTSYPTAPHFGPSVGAEQYGQWLEELPAELPLSLYLHVIYCAEMRWFCACHVSITKQYGPVAEYMQALWRELDLVRDRMSGPRRVKHLHFGGGSPTILTPEDFTKTVDKLRARYDFDADAEVAVELDPRTADEAYVRAMASVGVTRASIGVQDFNPKVQQAINRIQPYDITARTIDWLRRHGIDGVNMDLVYGLPFQTIETVLETIDQAAGLAPSRISLFGYAHVPWMKKHQRLIPEAALPDLAQRWQQYELAQARLAEHGYVAIGLDHFAKEGDSLADAGAQHRLHRNFQGYTTDEAPVLLGFGASGIGAMPQGYVANETELHAYKRIIGEGRLATARGKAFAGDDKLRRALIERLMCDMELDVEAVCAELGADPGPFDEEIASLAGMESDGLLVREGRQIRMTEEGRPLVRAAAAAFDTYLKAGEKRHSKAV